MEGNGQAVVYPGGWSDYVRQRGERAPKVEEKSKPSEAKVKQSVEKKKGLSFTEKHRLEALPSEIERLEAEIAKLEQLMADPELYSREPLKFKKATEALVERQEKLSAAEEEWLLLEDKASAETG